MKPPFAAQAKAGVVVRAGVELKSALVAHLPTRSLLLVKPKKGKALPQQALTHAGKKRFKVAYPHGGWVSAASLADERAFLGDLDDPQPKKVDLRPVPNATKGASFADFCKGRNGALAPR